MIKSRSIFHTFSRLQQHPPAFSRSFHPSFVKMVKVGDPIPSVELMETSPGTKVDLSKELKGKGLLIGVPAAYSPACSATHIPGYVSHEKTKDAGQVFVISVNDPFVMAAWGKTLDPTGKTGIRFLGDPTGKFTEALDLTFDSAAIFGNYRSKRYALTVEDGKIKSTHIEPDNTGVNESAAEKVLG